MKVEKCPRCNGGVEIDVYKNQIFFSCWCHAECAYLVAIARAKFNRWARREAKRIEKEETNRLMLLPDNTAICPRCFGTMFHKEWHYVCERCEKKIKEGATK